MMACQLTSDETGDAHNHPGDQSIHISQLSGEGDSVAVGHNYG